MSNPNSKKQHGCSSGHGSTFVRPETSSSEDTQELEQMRLDSEQDKISDSDIRDIPKLLGPADLKRFYYSSVFGLKMVEVGRIEYDNKGDGIEVTAYRVLETWRKRNASEATRGKVLQAMTESGCIEARRKLKEKWNMTEDEEDIQASSFKKKTIDGGIMIDPTWTEDGLSLNPKVSGFEDFVKIEISYEYRRDKCETYPLSELPHILKGVNNTWRGIVKATASDEMNVAKCQVSVKWEFNLPKFQENIADIYQQKIKRMVLFPWQQQRHQVRNIEDIYVQLELERAVRRNNEVLILSEVAAGTSEGTELITKEDFISLRTSHGDEVKRILLKGLAGSGKSSLLSKLAYDWSQKGKSPLSQFELVILLRMNKLEQNCDLIDAISKQISPVSESEIQGLKTYLNQNQREIIILMDAWDETEIKNISVDKSYPRSLTIEHILASQKLPKALVIVSSRPHKPLGTVQSDYVSVNLLGFSQDNIDKYIWKLLCDSINQDSVTEMIRQVHSSAMLQTMAKVPVILMILCTVWEYHQKFPDTLSSLYDKFLTTIWKRFEHNWENKPYIPFAVFQNRLGAIALQGLLSSARTEEDIIEFPEGQFSDICDLGLQVGFITKGWHFTDEEESFITFLHKSVQEFLAGKYFAQMYTNNPEEFNNTLKRIDSWKLVLQKFEVLKFCCGNSLQQNEYSDSNSGSVAIVSHVIKKYDEFYKAQNVSAKKQDMCKYDDKHQVQVGSYIDVGDMHQLQSKHVTAIDCLPILTLLHEAKLQDVTKLPSLFSESVFAKPMYVTINCSNSQTLMFFHNFLQSVGIATENIKSIRMFMKRLNELVPEILIKSVAQLSRLSTLILRYAVVDMADLLIHLSKSPHRSLRHVDLTYCRIGDAISEIGAVMTPHLTCLILSYTNLKERHIEILSKHLHNAPNLRLLDLSGNYIGESIGVLTQNLQHCNQLQTLKLHRTWLKENHTQILVTSTFLSSKSVDLLELDLSINSIGDNITALSNHLQHCQQLQVLALWNTNLDEHHIKTLIGVLPQTLQDLNLSRNVVGDSLISLIGTLQHCPQLIVLGLYHTHLTDSGVVVLGQHLHHWDHLSYLRLEGNDDIGNSGLDAIFTYIHHLPKLTEFTISATIDRSCSALVHDCLHAIGKRIPEGGGRIDIFKLGDNIQSILKLDNIQSILKLSRAASQI